MPSLVRSGDPPILPSPPKVEKSTEKNLYVTWRNSLPYPLGFIDMVEVQYRPIAIKDDLTLEELEEELNSADLQQLSSPSRRWNSLVTRQFHRNSFYEYLFDMLSPGRYYQFRLRYHCLKGWSDYSTSSPIYNTLAACPSTPHPPVCTTITSNAVELKWSLPANNNGSKIRAFVLVGRSVGYDEYIELYRGLRTSYLAIGLYPEFAYSFKIAVINGVGMSEFSHPVSVQTPMNSVLRAVRRQQNRRHSTGESKDHQNEAKHSNEDENSIEALLCKTELLGYTEQQIQLGINCREAWHEFWDPKIEQYFYFNTVLGYRQLQKPKILEKNHKNREDNEGAAEEEEDEGNVQENPIERLLNPKQYQRNKLKIDEDKPNGSNELGALENNLEFRKKRYKFLQDLHRHRRVTIDSLIKSKMPHTLPPRSSFDSSLPSRPATSSTSSKNEITKIDLHRELILQDFHHCLSTAIHSNARGSFSSGGQVNLNNNSLLFLLKRFKVNFYNEEGIDSGGLSKETFLLLSKEIVKYVKNDHRKWMDYTKGFKPHDLLHPHQKKFAYLEDDDENNVVKEKVEENNSTLSSEKGYIDGLFFCFDYSSNHSAPPSIPPSYLDNEFLTPAQLGAVVGILIGKAILDGHLMEFPISTTLIRYLIGEVQTSFVDPTLIMSTTSHDSKISKERIYSYIHALLKELQNIDVELHNSLKWMYENDITDIIDETFTIQKKIPSTGNGSKSELQTIALCPNGENIAVTEGNKNQYIYLVLLYKFKYSINDFMEPLLHYFHQMIPLELLKQSSHQVNVYEFYLLINGKKTINIEELRAYCIYESVTNKAFEADHPSNGIDDEEELFLWNETNPIVMWLWRILRESSDDNKKLFLQFFTGTTCIPLDGFNPPITIVYGIDMTKNSLPKAHICFHQLVLPKYDSFEKMKEKVLFAIHNTNSFGFS